MAGIAASPRPEELTATDGGLTLEAVAAAEQAGQTTVQLAKAGLGVQKLTPDVAEQFGLEVKRGAHDRPRRAALMGPVSTRQWQVRLILCASYISSARSLGDLGAMAYP